MDNSKMTFRSVQKPAGQQPKGGGQPAWQGNNPGASADAMEVDDDFWAQPPAEEPPAENDSQAPEGSSAGPTDVVAAPQTPQDPIGSMAALEESLPKTNTKPRGRGKDRQEKAPVPNTPAEIMAAFAKRLEESKRKHEKSPSTAQDERASKLQEQTEGDTASASAPKAPSPEPTTATTKSQRPDDYPFTSIRNPKRRPWCAIRVGTGQDAQVIGDSFSQSDGLQIALSIDAGNKGMPSVGLNFKINNQAKAKAVGEKKQDKKGAKTEEEDHTFTVGWEPGVQIDGEFMMESFECGAVGGLRGNAFPQELQDLTDNDKKKKNVYLMRFICHSTKGSFYDEEWARDLDEEEQAALRKLFTEVRSESLQILIWFVNPFAAPSILEEDCMAYFQDAVIRRLPPLHQYKDQDGKPVLNLDFPPSIWLMGDGMYSNYKMAGKPYEQPGIDESRPNFYNFPRQVVWDTIEDFHIYQGVPLVRESQFTKASIDGLNEGVHHVFLESAPFLRRGSQQIIVAEWIEKSCFCAGVRITPNAQGVKEAIPEENSLVKFDFREEDPRIGKPISQGRAHIWTGSVVRRPKEWFAKTQTDFCVMLTMPRGEDVPSRVYSREQYCPNTQLQRARIEVTYNPETFLRELDAINKFCDDDYQPELLAELRQAFVSNPSRAPTKTKFDLSRGPQGSDHDVNARHYQSYMETLRRQGKINAKQLAVLEAATQMCRRIACIAGPPDTGKTRSLQQLVTGLRYSRHTILVTAPSNEAVDNDATEIYHNLPDELREDTKMLRLDLGAAELQVILAQLNCTDFEGLEHKDPAKYTEFKDALDSPELTRVMQQMTVELAEIEDEHERLKKTVRNVEDVQESYRIIRTAGRSNYSNVPVGMLMGYRVWEIMQQDRRQAEKRYEEVKANTPEDGAHTMSGPEHISVNTCSSSHKYKEALALYVKRHGELSRRDKLAFNILCWEMVCRVLRETQILFTTCKNAVGPLVATGEFQPTIICCDEAGQATCPELFISMTNYEKWEGIFLFGDEKQLQPIQLAGSPNEFIQNAKLSPFRLLTLKNFPQVTRLDTQYSMAGAIASFPSRQFYDNGLLNGLTGHMQDDVRDKVLAFTKEELQLKDGSEYVIVNVGYGISRQEKTGKSLVNYANADCMIEFLHELLRRGVEAWRLKVLCYYRGQTRLMRDKIDEQYEDEEDLDNHWTQKNKKQLKIFTVDGFQGKESDVVLLDFVAAEDKLLCPKTLKGAIPEDEDNVEDQGHTEYVCYDRATTFVKDAHRLCIALTRARWGLFVFCQQALFERSLKKNKGKLANSVALMISDARERNLIWDNYVHEDSSEDGQAKRRRWTAADLEKAREKQIVDDLGYVNKLRAEAKKALHTPTIKEKIKYPIYKSTNRLTTRIVGSSVETDAADECASSYLKKSGTKVSP